MKKLFSFVATTLMCVTSVSVSAQEVLVKWELSDKDALSRCVTTGDEAFTSLITTSYEQGANIQPTAIMNNSGAASGYTSVAYVPSFTQFTPTTRVTTKTTGHSLSFVVTPSDGHKFKPLTLSVDAAKCGTDGGNFDIYVSAGGSQDEIQTALSPARNKIQEGNDMGYSHYEYSFADYIVDSKPFTVTLYVYNFNGLDNENPKSIAFRNLVIKGAVDEEIHTADHFISSMTCSAGDLTSLVSGLKYGESTSHPEKQYGAPTDFNVECKEGYTSEVLFDNNTATVRIQREGSVVFTFSVRFKVTNRQPKPAAKPLNRGLVAVKTGDGVLVSWRLRAHDDKNVKFNLYRGKTLINKSAPITAATNYLDKTGTVSSYYTLEVLNPAGEVIERQDSVKAWGSTAFVIPTSTPADLRGTGATYTPNDCSVCDMDGDGEYEIIVKWDPSNSKDAASGGVTGSTYLDCYKMDGTQLWRIDLGQNIRSGAHTTPYLCYDFDLDGYGELIVKTAPGTIDGEGNYVVMDGDDPKASYIDSNGRILSGPEYLTVFDGLTGGEIHTVKYHTTFAEGSSYWGDSYGNRSDRYLACMAYLDGERPSAVMCRGYYSGAFVAAYEFDGDQLTQRWYHKSIQKGKGLWGEGAHCITVGDVDFDGKDEITYGSAALDDDGTLLYRTGLGHGDALHMGDFIPERPGLEVFMVHESKPYGFDIRDARTGELIAHNTAEGDTGRGLMADFDDQHDGAECMATSSASLFDCYGQHISNWQSGTVSSSSINFRIYWDGDLMDEYMDRAHIDKWDSNSKSFGRLITLYNNGSTTINYSKNNPNLQADFLGDWREEVIHYNSETNALIITTTDHTSPYKVPTLMDDRQYCEAIVWQNVAYNQPPHVSFDPISRFTIHRTPIAYGETAERWTPFFSTYPVVVPEGCQVYTVSGYAEDTLKLVKRTAKYIPANTGVLICTDKEELSFRPSVQTATYNGVNNLKGACVDSLLTTEEDTYTYFYIFKDGEHGLGYYRADAEMCNANEAFLRIKGSSSRIPADYYIIGRSMNPTAIQSVTTDGQNAGKQTIYTLQGIQVESVTYPGVYIINGKKVRVRR